MTPEPPAFEVGFDEEIDQLWKRVRATFGEEAVTEALGLALLAAPFVHRKNADGSVSFCFRPGFTAAVKRELQRVLAKH